MHVQKSYLQIFLICIVAIFLVASCNQQSKKNSEKNIEKTNNDPKALALLYLSENRLDEAVAAFQQAIKMNPEDSATYIGLTRLYLLQKNYDAAENLCKEGLKIKPGNIDLKLLLAEIYSLKNDKENAAKELKEIIEKDPKNVNAYYLLDSISSNQNSRKYYLLKVLSVAPANIVPRLQLAELFAGEGKTDSSLFYLQSVKKIAPGFSDAAEISYQKATSLLNANTPALALPYIKQFHSLMKITPEYATGSDEIKIPDVLPLLQKADDEYIIANSGDQVSIDFDAKNVPLLPKGWTRDFLIYSEGWVKDGDLNTAHGQTVDPLPFHAMPSYPYGKNITYPADKAHREYQEKYNTRKVSDYDFKNAVRLGMEDPSK